MLDSAYLDWKGKEIFMQIVWPYEELLPNAYVAYDLCLIVC